MSLLRRPREPGPAVQIVARTPAHEATVWAMFQAAEYPPGLNGAQRLAWLSRYPARAAWVAMRGSDLLGHVAVADVQGGAAKLAWERARPEWAGKMLVVGRLFIAPAARGQGLGRRLLTTAADDIHRFNCLPVMTVPAQDWPAAHALCAAAGFRPVPGGDTEQLVACVGPPPAGYLDW
jgi:GNAT superfamily N-acetyltransferase